MAEWKEWEHPRDGGGKFTDKDSRAAGKEIGDQLKAQAERIARAAPEFRQEKFVKDQQTAKSAPKFEPVTSGETFRKMLMDGKEKKEEIDRWRVSSDYSVEDYNQPGMKLYNAGGSVYALHEHGKGKDIISVCTAENGARGYEILADAVANGGDRLDAFGKRLYRFYTRNGFEPVSWTPFNAEYAPDDWKSAKAKGLDVKEEPVIFYKYTGKTPKYTYEEFLQAVKPDEGENGYDTAMQRRDEEIDG